MRALALLCAALVLSACGTDDDAMGVSAGAGARGAPYGPQPDSDVGELGPRLVGIYALDQHFANLAACEPGDSIVLGHAFFALLVRTAPGYSDASAISCSSVEDCRAVQSMFLSGRLQTTFYYRFFDNPSTTTLTGRDLLSVQVGEQCYQQLTDVVLEETAPGTLHLDARVWHGPSYPKTSSSCSVLEGETPSIDEPCTEYRALDASFVEALP